MKLLLNRNSDGAELSLEDKLVLKAFASGGIVNVQYLDEKDGYRKSVEVSNTLAQIGAISDVLTATADIDGTVIWINKDRVTGAEDVNGLAVLKFDSSGAAPEAIKLNVNVAAWQTLVIAKEGDFVYTVDSFTAAPNVIVLDSGDGDVTAKFTSGVVFTVFGEGDDNDAIYTVVSSAFTTTTNITVTETPTAKDPAVGFVWLKA